VVAVIRISRGGGHATDAHCADDA